MAISRKETKGRPLSLQKDGIGVEVELDIPNVGIVQKQASTRRVSQPYYGANRLT